VLAQAHALLVYQGQALRVLIKISTLRVVFLFKNLDNPAPHTKKERFLFSFFSFFLFSFEIEYCQDGILNEMTTCHFVTT